MKSSEVHVNSKSVVVVVLPQFGSHIKIHFDLLAISLDPPKDLSSILIKVLNFVVILVHPEVYLCEINQIISIWSSLKNILDPVYVYFKISKIKLQIAIDPQHFQVLITQTKKKSLYGLIDKFVFQVRALIIFIKYPELHFRKAESASKVIPYKMRKTHKKLE